MINVAQFLPDRVIALTEVGRAVPPAVSGHHTPAGGRGARADDAEAFAAEIIGYPEGGWAWQPLQHALPPVSVPAVCVTRRA